MNTFLIMILMILIFIFTFWEIRIGVKEIKRYIDEKLNIEKPPIKNKR